MYQKISSRKQLNEVERLAGPTYTLMSNLGCSKKYFNVKTILGFELGVDSFNPFDSVLG